MIHVSEYLAAPSLAWALSQLLKYILASRVTGNYRNLRIFLQSGSMPSVHTAAVTALAVIIGVRIGMDSAEFALTAIFGIIVAYDAMQVRRSTGEQGAVLKELVAIAKLTLAKPAYHAMGHKPIEVITGAAIGIISGLSVLAF